MSEDLFSPPGDPEQLSRAVIAAERVYEQRLAPMVVFWDEGVKRYRFIYLSQYKETGTIEVLRIPK